MSNLDIQESGRYRSIGHQAGGRVFLFLRTDDFWRDYEAYRSRGVLFREEPRAEPYGTVAVFDDLYGNRWDLLRRIKLTAVFESST
jgi:hypothetical protein